jgi:hypothetical protein
MAILSIAVGVDTLGLIADAGNIASVSASAAIPEKVAMLARDIAIEVITAERVIISL